MKKTLLLILAFSSSLCAFGQFPVLSKPYTFGIKAGVNVHRYIFVQKRSYNVDSRSAIGYQISGFFDTPVAPLISFQPGFALVQKGGDYTGNNDIPVQHRFVWFQIPVHLVGKIPVRRGNYFIGAGTYGGFALTGRKTVNLPDQHTRNPISFGYNPTDDSEYDDFGVSFTGGFRTARGITLQLGYEQGLTDLRPDGFGIDGKRTNRVYSFSVGYSFFR
ncbi:MAG TPA: outer membrane beta-barrel protein [Sphingobacteriaceae bacterium]